MKMVSVYEIRAFTEEQVGGNSAGVVLEAGELDLSERDMQQIASEMGFSETAFVFPSENADYRLRFFTPSNEVELCGHATIATFWLLQHLGRLNGQWDLSQETAAGILQIQVTGQEILMTQKAPEFGPILEPDEILWSLGLSESSLMPGLPVQIVSTGLKDILIPVESETCLQTLQPDLDEIRRISEALGVVGYHVFTLAGEEGTTARCRNFAPLYGIDEESATGTSNGALAAYLSAYGAVNEDQMRFSQGLWMGNPSSIRVKVVWDQEREVISKVWVGGQGSLAGIRTVGLSTD